MTPDFRPTRPDQTDFEQQTFLQKFTVSFEYPVCFTRDCFAPDNEVLGDAISRNARPRRHRCMVYVDAGVDEAHPDLRREIQEYFHARRDRLCLAASPRVVPGGEQAKNDWSCVRDIMTELGNLHLDRQSFVLAVGGGSMLDMTGFATSILHRGLRLIRLPTTTLAQNDAGIGVKNGMDEHGQKNFVGTFAPPFAVINDLSFLSTLRQEDWIAGVAEAFKVALIRDADFFEMLCQNASRLRLRDQAAMEEVVRRCCALHLHHIRTSGDPFEFGSARPLDFGHWAAHKLELMSGFSLGHGQAVAIGICLDALIALRNSLLGEEDFLGIHEAIASTGLPTFHDLLLRRNRSGVLEILEGLDDFREHLGGDLCVTLPDGIGRGVEVHQINPGDVREAVEYLHYRSRQGGREE
jgi:3-dehydroquinate synthase